MRDEGKACVANGWRELDDLVAESFDMFDRDEPTEDITQERPTEESSDSVEREVVALLAQVPEPRALLERLLENLPKPAEVAEAEEDAPEQEGPGHA